MDVEEAKRLYKTRGVERSESWRPWRRKTFEVTMLDRLSSFYPGNKKIIDSFWGGHNTAFRANFKMVKLRKGWKLKYNLRVNRLGVRLLSDRVRWIDGDLLVGRFCYAGIPLGWFTMERI